MTRAEEQALIKRAARGDRAAAEAVIRAHQASLYAYLLRMSGRPEVAEDMTQEAFVRILAALDRFDPRFRFSTWIFTIGRRLLVNHLQRCRPHFDTDGMASVSARWPPPDADVERDETADATHVLLQRALMELPPEQREVLILFHQLDWPIALIADHTGMPQGTVKSHLHRGRRRLRDIMERNGAGAEKLGFVGEAVA
jgi:RNA polymerase sigma-70 factor (ECF subfamily)